MVLDGAVRKTLGAILLGWVWLCVSAAPSRAVEEAPAFAERRAEAARLADEAVSLLEQQQCKEAREQFRRADEVLHSPAFVVFMARAEICLGRLVQAQALLQRVVDEKLADYAPEPFWEAKKEARTELAGLAPRVPKWSLRIVGATRSETTVRLDGQEVDPGELTSPVSINPGDHQVEAETLDGRHADEAFSVAEGDTAEIELDLGEPFDGDGSGDGSDGGDGWWQSPYLPAGIAYGVGGAGLVMGIITGALFVGRADDLKERCPNDRCAPEDEEEGDAVSTLGNVSTVGFIVAGVGALTGTILLFVVPGDDNGTETAVRAGPSGILLEGTF